MINFTVLFVLQVSGIMLVFALLVPMFVLMVPHPLIVPVLENKDVLLAYRKPSFLALQMLFPPLVSFVPTLAKMENHPPPLVLPQVNKIVLSVTMMLIWLEQPMLLVLLVCFAPTFVPTEFLAPDVLLPINSVAMIVTTIPGCQLELRIP